MQSPDLINFLTHHHHWSIDLSLPPASEHYWLADECSMSPAAWFFSLLIKKALTVLSLVPLMHGVRLAVG